MKSQWFKDFSVQNTFLDSGPLTGFSIEWFMNSTLSTTIKFSKIRGDFPELPRFHSAFLKTDGFPD